MQWLKKIIQAYQLYRTFKELHNKKLIKKYYKFGVIYRNIEKIGEN